MFIQQNNGFDPADGELIARFTSYMVKVVTSAKINYVQRYKRGRLEIPMDKPSESHVGLEDLERWQNSVQDNEFFFAEERISDALSNLSYLRRRILELSYIEELSALEIAETLNCSVKFVYNHKHTALKKLRDKLLRGGELDE